MKTATKLAPLRKLKISTYGTVRVNGILCYKIGFRESHRIPASFRYVGNGTHYAYIAHQSDDKPVTLRPSSPDNATVFTIAGKDFTFFQLRTYKGERTCKEMHREGGFAVKGKPERVVYWDRLLEGHAAGTVSFWTLA
jgi:hypothetical protein